jgi:hypothetical protein
VTKTRMPLLRRALAIPAEAHFHCSEERWLLPRRGLASGAPKSALGATPLEPGASTTEVASVPGSVESYARGSEEPAAGSRLAGYPYPQVGTGVRRRGSIR